MNIKQYRNRLKTVLELFQSCFIFHNSTTMSYSIKDLAKHWLSKNLIYEALKNSLPFSSEFIKNKRLFNETDLKLFLFYKTNGLEKTLLQYGTVNENNDNKTVFKTVLWNRPLGSISWSTTHQFWCLEQQLLCSKQQIGVLSTKIGA